MKLSRIFHVLTNKTHKEHQINNILPRICLKWAFYTLTPLSSFTRLQLGTIRFWNELLLSMPNLCSTFKTFFLTDKNTFWIPQDFKAKKIPNFAKTRYIKLMLHGIFMLWDNEFIITTKDQIINMQAYIEISLLYLS